MTRTLEGQKTLLSRSTHHFGYDSIHDEIVMPSPLAQAIITFRGGAHGEEPPLRVIQGPKTQILGSGGDGNVDRVFIDPANNEYYLPVAPNTILVFDRLANGDVPPKRVISFGEPGDRIRIGMPVAVDPIRNLLVVNAGQRGFMIFDRTVSGKNPKPKGVIAGPATGVGNHGYGATQVYAPKGLIIAGCFGASVCAWGIEDYGDVAPRFRIPVQQLTGYVASGIALNPANKEIIISAVGRNSGQKPPSGIVNATMTFTWPEVF
jgi:hypothetical protein